jgi:acyl carrier protein
MITREEILNIVKKHLMDNIEDLEESTIDPSRSMKEMGANSLDIVEVVSCSMRDLKVKVPRSELAQLTDMNGLVDLLHNYASQKQAAASA